MRGLVEIRPKAASISSKGDAMCEIKSTSNILTIERPHQQRSTTKATINNNNKDNNQQQQQQQQQQRQQSTSNITINSRDIPLRRRFWHPVLAAASCCLPGTP